MTHVRKQVRDAAIANLKGKTVAGGNVYARGAQPVHGGSIPDILVRTPSEDAERLDYDDVSVRSIDLELTLRQKERTNIDDEIDAFCSEVETLMTSLAPAFDLEYQSTELQFPAEGQDEFGYAVLTYEVTVHTGAGAPETSLKNT